MFDPPTWTKCFVHFWFGDALPNQDRPKKLTFEQIFLCLFDRSELQYDLDSDDEPYRAPSKSRFDEPDFVLVAGGHAASAPHVSWYTRRFQEKRLPEGRVHDREGVI